MRIISGLYRGRVLKSPPNFKTRPTSDRLRETLFNILTPKINKNIRFLDLCAGTGAIGIEAISRGVTHATFVDKSRKACGLIEKNLDLLEIPEEQTDIFCMSSERFISREINNSWDLIFFDPPYEDDYSTALGALASEESLVLSETGVLVAEHHSKTLLPDSIGSMRRWRVVKQGENHLSFFEKV